MGIRKWLKIGRKRWWRRAMKTHLLSQAVSVLGQSWPSSLISAQSSLCSNHVYRGHELHFRIFMEPPRLRSNLQASIWNSGKKEFWSSPSTTNNVISATEEWTHLGSALQRETQGVHLAELLWASPTCRLCPSVQVPKTRWGSTALTKQTQLEEAWVYPLCSVTG